VVAYLGISAIVKRETSIGPANDWGTQYEETTITGVLAIIIGIALLALSIYLVFFATDCAPIIGGS
jgi:hypothetical protein